MPFFLMLNTLLAFEAFFVHHSETNVKAKELYSH